MNNREMDFRSVGHIRESLVGTQEQRSKFNNFGSR